MPPQSESGGPIAKASQARSIDLNPAYLIWDGWEITSRIERLRAELKVLGHSLVEANQAIRAAEKDQAQAEEAKQGALRRIGAINAELMDLAFGDAPRIDPFLFA